MLTLFLKPWFFFGFLVVVFLIEIVIDWVLLNKEQRLIKRYQSNLNPFQVVAFYFIFSSIRYFKHIYNKNWAIAGLVLAVVLSSFLLLKILLSELRAYDRTILPARYLQIKRVTTVLLAMVLLSSIPWRINRLIISGYVPLSKFDYTTPMLMAFLLFVGWLLVNGKGPSEAKNSEYKPIFKQDPS